jgi:hypothetical protein
MFRLIEVNQLGFGRTKWVWVLEGRPVSHVMSGLEDADKMLALELECWLWDIENVQGCTLTRAIA